MLMCANEISSIPFNNLFIKVQVKSSFKCFFYLAAKGRREKEESGTNINKSVGCW